MPIVIQAISNIQLDLSTFNVFLFQSGILFIYFFITIFRSVLKSCHAYVSLRELCALTLLFDFSNGKNGNHTAKVNFDASLPKSQLITK